MTSDPEAVMRATVLSVVAVSLAFVLVGCDEAPPEQARPKEERPPLELRLSMDGESKPAEGEMVGRWELINQSDKPMEFVYETAAEWISCLRMEAADPDGNDLGLHFLDPHTTSRREPEVLTLAPGS